MNRRKFLKGLGKTIALSSLPGLHSYALSPSIYRQPNEEVFIFVFLRGGFDALNFVAPMGDRFYADARSTGLKVNEKTGLGLKNGLSGWDFSLHPNAAALKELYDSQKMAIIPACGLDNGTRSHFEAMDMIERGINQKKGSTKGWMTRYFDSINHAGLLPAVAIGQGLPSSFMGCQQAASIDRLKDYKVQGGDSMHQLLKSFYQGDSSLLQTGQQTFKTIEAIQQKIAKNKAGAILDYHPEHGSQYPDDWQVENFSSSLQQLARLIKMDMGIHFAMLEYGDWDHHENQAYRFPQQLEGLSNALAAFYNDMHAYHSKITLVVMSEFGRRLKSNRSGGTDHGHGGVALVLGGQINGGKMYGTWPGLASHQLDNGVDLEVTTDYRSIFSEILIHKLNATRLDYIFPGFNQTQRLGFV
jgi:uncharacterized protein (DUF1501 family)